MGAWQPLKKKKRWGGALFGVLSCVQVILFVARIDDSLFFCSPAAEEVVAMSPSGSHSNYVSILFLFQSRFQVDDLLQTFAGVLVPTTFCLLTGA